MNKRNILLAALLVTILLVGTVVVLAICFTIKTRDDHQVATTHQKSVYRTFQSYAVVSDTNICSSIGKSVLEKHGSAVDAAIATMVCVGAVNVHSCGIGGGHIAVIYDKPSNETKKVLTTLTARERAPLKSTRDMFRNISSKRGILSSAVPGEIKGFFLAWQKFGKLAWKELIDPTAALLEDGFIVERDLAQVIVEYKDFINKHPGIRERLTKSDGTMLKEGDTYRDPVLAKTMRYISTNPRGFYEGVLAKIMVQEIQQEGGIISEDDLRRYDVEWKDATVVKLQGTRLKHYSVRPPSSGAVLGLILNVMAGYKLTPDSFLEKNLSLTLHRLIEVSKFAFAGRNKLGDEKFDNFSDLVKKLASKEFAEKIRSKIDDSRTYTDPSHYGGIYEEARDGGTAHVSVYAADGSAVSLTSTINNAFGSGVRGQLTGILYNNEMNLFTGLDEKSSASHLNISNKIEPYKIPMSSMSPSVIMDEHSNVALITGASGGPRIITSIAAVILGSIFGNETLDVTVDRPRVHHQLSPNNVMYEKWMDEKHVDDLKMKGHVMNLVMRTAVCGTIKIKNDFDKGMHVIEAVSDGRKGGRPEGL